MDINEVYDMAEAEKIEIANFQLDETKSMSMMAETGDCYIAIDEKQFQTTAELKVALVHEVGHCKTGAFRNVYSPFDLVCQHEYRANRQAVLDLVPYDGLMHAFHSGYVEVWELAEYFELTEDFIRTALSHYERMGKDFK